MSRTEIDLHVVIGMPSFRGTITTSTVTSLINLTSMFNQSGIGFTFLNVDGAEITVVRNQMASYAQRHAHVTHLLFIDDDMVFEPDAVLELFRGNKPIAGLICPRRHLNLKTLWESAQAGADYDTAYSNATTFVVRHISNTTIRVEHGWFQLAGIGMGVTLIRRDVLDGLVEHGKLTVHRVRDLEAYDSTGNPFQYGFFDPIPNEENGELLSEDLSFCERWREDCKGEIWANASYEVGHIGQMNYSAKYLDRVRTGRS